MLSFRIALSAIFFCTALAAADAGLTVTAESRAEAKYLRGGRVYPEYLLDMSRAADWARIGSAGGHGLKVAEVECPGQPGRRGLMFSVKIDKKNPKAPGWVAWESMLSPELSLVGVDEIEFDIYPLQKFPFGVVARFGTMKGFGQLPCTWSDVVKGLEPGRWHTVRIPVKKSRLSVDSLRFDFNARNDAVPHQQEMSMIVAAIRFLPAPHPATAVYSTGMKSAGAVSNGFILNPHPLEMADGTDLEYSVELAVGQQMQAELEIECGKKVYTQSVTLTPPCTVLHIRLPEPAKLLPPGDYELKTTLRTGEKQLVAEGREAMPLSFFSAAVMDRKRQQLKLRLEALRRSHAELTEAALPLVTLTTVGLFLDHFIPDDFNRQKKYRIAMTELDEVEGLLNALEAELADYRAGKIRELPVVPYDPELELTVRDGVITQDGRPILLIGPLAGMPAISWSRYASSLGFNSLVVETDMDGWLNFEAKKNHTVKKSPDLVRGSARSYRGEASLVKDYLERCRVNRLAANLLLSSHYCRKLPEDLANARSSHAGHNNFDWNVLAPEAKEAFRRMYGNIVPFLKDKPYLVSLGTANEPDYAVKAVSADFRRGFVEYLKEKYGTVGSLNLAWGKRYSAFDAAASGDAVSEQAPSQAKVDWAEYRSLAVNRFYGFLKDRLLSSLPGKQVWVKLMGDIGYEMLDEEENIGLGQNVAGSDSSRELWLDHLRSLFPELPVTNHEWHFLRSGYTSDPAFLAQRMYQGVTRGLQSGNIWRGMRADWESKGHGHVESFSRYPLGLNAVGRTSYRLRMHYPVLLRFQQLDGGQVRLYYDKKAHLLQGKSYKENMYSLYDRLRINPDGVRFLYPDKAARGEFGNVKLIAAGTLRYLPQESAAALVGWVKEGGILWLDAPVEWRDYAGRELALPDDFTAALHSAGYRNFGKGAVAVGADYRGYAGMMSGAVGWSGDAPNPAVECRVLRGKGGKMEYLSIVNLGEAEQKVRLMDGNSPVAASGTDIWNNDAAVALQEEITLSSFAVKLIRMD